jgi:hypothetical protein
MSLLDEIKAKCPPDLLATKNDAAIAATVSKTRTKPSTKEIGNGTILETIGLEHGNAMLDVIYNDQQFRHVKPLLEQGRLIVGSPLVVATIKGMAAGGVIPDAARDALLSLTVEPDPVSDIEVRRALWSDAGEYLA